MEESNKTIAAILVGASIATGGATVYYQEQLASEIQKKEVAQESYVCAQVRLDEIPTVDISKFPLNEVSDTYARIANKYNARERENLFEGIKEKVAQEDIPCAKI